MLKSIQITYKLHAIFVCNMYYLQITYKLHTIFACNLYYIQITYKLHTNYIQITCKSHINQTYKLRKVTYKLIQI